ncbi:hypothetical protein RFI_10835 [Reticulomyxa filosa]|uniref:Uncharacterized protein n=1 Tax=Reticulomyxa filosa TaxID=46433 RepID=X6NIZ6_RETFI|nr:hypothetical protein RFI_10835 [Reticulomyxa filosa]|eukprot:ETO26300.1 hypothetical protein RFI_10835 [Reticulomyxa filosa]
MGERWDNDNSRNIDDFNFTGKGIDQVIAAWVYFIVIFIVAFTVHSAERLYSNPAKIAKELNLKMPLRKALKGDKTEQEKQNQLKKQASQRRIDQDELGNARRVLNFVETEARSFFDRMTELFISTSGNVVALDNAVELTFAKVTGKKTTTIGLSLLYAIFVSVLGAYVALKMGDWIEKEEEILYDGLKQQHWQSLRRQILRFAAKFKNIVSEHTLFQSIITTATPTNK